MEELPDHVVPELPPRYREREVVEQPVAGVRQLLRQRRPLSSPDGPTPDEFQRVLVEYVCVPQPWHDQVVE